MHFIVSKALEQIIIPSNFLLLIGILGVLLVFWRRRLGAALAAFSIVALAICGWSSVGALALAPLENRFPPPEIASPPTGIISLGGAVDIHLTADRKMVQVNQAAERLTETAALARRFPEARVFLSGGLGHVGADMTVPSESAVGRQFLLELGIAADRISMEENSRTTCENAAETLKALHPQPTETWLLVTSAWHMPRAVACFRALKFNVVPYPVDYRTALSGRYPFVNKSAVIGLDNVDTAVHEWIGLLAYWLTGKTTEILPS